MSNQADPLPVDGLTPPTTASPSVESEAGVDEGSTFADSSQSMEAAGRIDITLLSYLAPSNSNATSQPADTHELDHYSQSPGLVDDIFLDTRNEIPLLSYLAPSNSDATSQPADTHELDHDPQSPGLDDDIFLDTWDFTIHRCADCHRPYYSANRLIQHKLAYHTSNSLASKDAPVYAPPTILPGVDPSPHPEPTIIEIFPDGDLILIFPNPTCADSELGLRVASQVLRVVSPVFNTMLSPSSTFAESTAIRRAVFDPSQPAVIRLKDDDAMAAQEVLLALHHKYECLKSAEQMDFQLLVKIAEFADKYRLAAAIKPVMVKWVENLEWYDVGKVGVSVPRRGEENALTICWVFGMMEQVEAMLKELPWRGAVAENKVGKRLIFKRANLLIRLQSMVELSESLPDVILEELFRLREERIEIPRMAFCNIRERRNQVSNHLHTICRVDLPPRDKTVYDCEASRDYKRNQMRLSCDALQHGYLLQTIKGYNLDTVEFWNSSARNILRTLSRFQEASFTLIHSEATEHNDCSWTAGLRFQASEMMKKEVDLSEKMKNILSKREKSVDPKAMRISGS